MKRPQFSLMETLLASPTEPMPDSKRDTQLTRMYAALADIEQSHDACPDHWRVISDAVNILETLCEMGHMADDSGLLQDAAREMHSAAVRFQAGKPLRLSGVGIQSVRSILEDYRDAVTLLPARTVMQAMRQTEKRIREIQQGKTRASDVVVTI